MEKYNVILIIANHFLSYLVISSGKGRSKYLGQQLKNTY